MRIPRQSFGVLGLAPLQSPLPSAPVPSQRRILNVELIVGFAGLTTWVPPLLRGAVAAERRLAGIHRRTH